MSTYRFPLFHSRPMEWSEEHGVLFLRLARNIFGPKKGSSARGLAWEAIVDSVSEILSPKFQLKDKKSCTRAVEPSAKKVQQKDERGREGKWDFCGRVNGEGITDRGVSRERRYHTSKG